ncbi:MAG: c-type cytochrome, partial [Vicingaceae bacterium]
VEEVVEEVAEEATGSVDGSELFTSSGCVACHQAEVKTVGPSIKEIKEAYADNSAGLVAFLNGEGEAIVDVAQAAVMAPQVETTKAMTAEERTAIADYLLK